MNILNIILSEHRIVYLQLLLNSLIIYVILCLIKRIIKRCIKIIKDERKEYNVFYAVKVTINIIFVLLLLFVWEDYIQNIITLVSFLSAAFAIAIRDIIFNWICGIYIKIAKPFKVEDRIEIEGTKGDVINISLFAFEILEVSTDEHNGQSTGIVINYPASTIFTKSIKNQTKGFKYIWNEMNINIQLDANLKENKKEIYKIINNIDVVKAIPKKMKNQISEVNTTYRIYYNNYEPIIYTKIEEGHIVLTLRYLINPKKARYIESMVWNKIYEAYRDGKINLFIKED